MLFLGLGLIQKTLGIHTVGIDIVRDYPTFQHQYADVVRIYRQSFVGYVVHFVELLFVEIILHKPGVNSFRIFALGIFRDKILAELDARVGLRGSVCVVKRFVSLLFFGINFRRFRGVRRTALWSRGLSRLGWGRSWRGLLLLLRDAWLDQRQRGSNG